MKHIRYEQMQFDNRNEWNDKFMNEIHGAHKKFLFKININDVQIYVKSKHQHIDF